MRGEDRHQDTLFSYVSPEARIPKDHPLRPIRSITDAVLRRMSGDFERIYSPIGRPSIPPEKLLRALVLQALYTIRSERMLMEQLEYNLLFRWFVGLNIDERVWQVTVFSKNRERFIDGEIGTLFFEQVVAEARACGLLSDEHFTVDGTLIEAWASQKSFKLKESSSSDSSEPPEAGGKNPSVSFRGENRSNDTHQSTTDPEARLYRKSKGQEAKLGYLGHVVTENRNGLVVGCELTQATGRAEREAAVALMDEVPRNTSATLGADKGYDTKDFVEEMRKAGVTPHVAQNTSNRSSAIDGRTTRHPGYLVSQRLRKKVEEIFGWLKTIGTMRQTRHRGRRRVGFMFTLAAAAYDLVRIRNLMEMAA